MLRLFTSCMVATSVFNEREVRGNRRHRRNSQLYGKKEVHTSFSFATLAAAAAIVNADD